jgi:4-amino-4-deoxy-L-arabinose transferase-like glycosyltransferase/heme exporter protein D
MSRVAQWLLPGERRVWLAAGAVLVPIAIVVLVALLQQREYFTGTNSVAPRDGVIIVKANQTLCIPRVELPAGTGAVRIVEDSQQSRRPQIRMTVATDTGQFFISTRDGSPRNGLQSVDFPIPTTPRSPLFVTARVCVTPAAGYIVGLGRATLQSNDLPVLLDGQPMPDRIGVFFLPPNHHKRSLLSHMGEMFHRAALFRPSWVGAWTYWLLLFAVFPLAAYAGLRMMALADSPARRRLPLFAGVVLVAFVVAGSWALITPAFQSPDEPEHFGYAQYLAETGRAVDLNPGTRPPYSTAEGLALEATRETSVIERNDGKMPWFSADQAAWRARVATYKPGPSRTNGGGFHPAISPHSPAYYALLAPAYLATRHDSPFAQLTAMRLLSALMGALTAGFAYLIMRELLPARRTLAVAAGLLVAFEPMFGFISGAINNDDGVNLACAAIIYLLVRALRRGLKPWVAVALGAALVAAPVLKATGYELYPPAILALLALLWRRHSRRDLLMLAVLAASFVVLEVGWSHLATHFHRTTYTTPAGGSPVGILPANHDIAGYLSWLTDVLSPWHPPFLVNWTAIGWPAYHIYVVRGFASFGWYAIQFPDWVYHLIVGVMLAALALGIASLLHLRAGVRRRLPEILFLVLVPITVVAAVEAAYYPALIHLPLDGIAEQGRYAFPAITALAALVIGACHGFGRRHAVTLATALVAGLIGLTFASQLLTLSSFYT